MPDNEDDILAREIGKAGELGAKLGGLFNSESVLGKAAGLGGMFGAEIVAKFLPTETYAAKIHLKVSPEIALKLGFSVLTKLGRLKAEEDPRPPYPFLKAVIGSGFLNLNPAIVYLEILTRDATGCEVTITAAAKEGLIKQHTATKAVQRVVTALTMLLK
jgi:hypothetical protein